MDFKEKKVSFFKPSFAFDREIFERQFHQYYEIGNKVNIFEKKFAEYLNKPSSIAFKSGTLALHLALYSLNLKHGDEVITSNIVCEGVLNAIEQAKAKPILLDVERRWANINTDLIEAKITDKTKAIIGVHYGGVPCDVDIIQSICKKYGIFFIEDCAQAIGATYNNLACGHFGDIAIFSFYANKIITTGEGGGLVGDPALLRKIRNLCYSKQELAEIDNQSKYSGIKFNYLMDDLAATIGIEQIKQISNFIRKRREIFELYNHYLQNLEEVTVPNFPSKLSPSFYQYVLTLDMKSKNKNVFDIIQKLSSYGIKAYADFIPNHQRSYYKEKYNLMDNEFPISSEISNKRLCLPCYPLLKESEIILIARTLVKLLSSN